MRFMRSLSPRSRRLLSSALQIAFATFIAWFFCNFAFHEYRATRPQVSVTAEQILTGDVPFSCSLDVSGCTPLMGEPVIVPRDDGKTNDAFLPVALTNPTNPTNPANSAGPIGEPRLLIVQWNPGKTEIDLNALSDTGRCSGLLRPNERLWGDVKATFESEFAEVAPGNYDLLQIGEEGAMFIVMFFGVAALITLSHPITVARSLYRHRKWEQHYADLLAATSPRAYADFPSVLSACGVNQYGVPTHCRTVDRTWKPTNPPADQKPSLAKTWLTGVAGWAVGIAAITDVTYGVENLSYAAELGLWQRIGLIGLGAATLPVFFKLIFRFDEQHAERSEEIAMSPEECGFKKCNHYRLHRRVLEDLGMRSAGDYRKSTRQLGLRIGLARTVFVSRCGDFFVEVGWQSWFGSYICVGTFLNDNTFMETHSGLHKTYEVMPDFPTPGKITFYRQAAFNLNVMKVIKLHEELVQENTASMQHMIAEITPENVTDAIQFASRIVHGNVDRHPVG